MIQDLAPFLFVVSARSYCCADIELVDLGLLCKFSLFSVNFDLNESNIMVRLSIHLILQFSVIFLQEIPFILHVFVILQFSVIYWTVNCYKIL